MKEFKGNTIMTKNHIKSFDRGQKITASNNKYIFLIILI